MGMLSEFDRLRLRGTLRWLAHTGGMCSGLWSAQLLLKHLKRDVTQATEKVRPATFIRKPGNQEGNS